LDLMSVAFKTRFPPLTFPSPSCSSHPPLRSTPSFSFPNHIFSFFFVFPRPDCVPVFLFSPRRAPNASPPCGDPISSLFPLAPLYPPCVARGIPGTCASFFALVILLGLGPVFCPPHTTPFFRTKPLFNVCALKGVAPSIPLPLSTSTVPFEVPTPYSSFSPNGIQEEHSFITNTAPPPRLLSPFPQKKNSLKMQSFRFPFFLFPPSAPSELSAKVLCSPLSTTKLSSHRSRRYVLS